MTTQIQKAYNRLYGCVNASARMLEILVRTMEVKPPAGDVAHALMRFTVKLQESAEDLETIADYFECNEMREAHERLVTSISDLRSAADAFGLGDNASSAGSLRVGVKGLEITKRLLESQNHIRYRLWLLNPWRYYPQRLNARPLPGGPPSLEE